MRISSISSGTNLPVLKVIGLASPNIASNFVNISRSCEQKIGLVGNTAGFLGGQANIFVLLFKEDWRADHL